MGIEGKIVDGRLHLQAKENHSATGVRTKAYAHYSRDRLRKVYKAVSVFRSQKITKKEATDHKLDAGMRISPW